MNLTIWHIIATFVFLLFAAGFFLVAFFMGPKKQPPVSEKDK
jgi:hypothetical protein